MTPSEQRRSSEMKCRAHIERSKAEMRNRRMGWMLRFRLWLARVFKEEV